MGETTEASEASAEDQSSTPPDEANETVEAKDEEQTPEASDKGSLSLHYQEQVQPLIDEIQAKSDRAQAVLEQIEAAKNTATQTLETVNGHHETAGAALAKIQEIAASIAASQTEVGNLSAKVTETADAVDKSLADVQPVQQKIAQTQLEVEGAATRVSQQEQAATVSAAGAEAQNKTAIVAATEVTGNQVASAAALADIQSALQKSTSHITQTTAHVTETAALLAQATTNKTAIADILSTASTTQENILNLQKEARTTGGAITATLTSAKSSEQRIVEIGERVAALEGIIKQRDKELSDWQGRYNGALTDWQGRYKELYDQIENLLPGATSANLATAFRDQKESYKWPKVIYSGLFIAAAIFLALSYKIAVPQEDTWAKNITNPWEGILTDLVHKGPFYLPSLLVLFFTYRAFTMADKMQQDYAYKEKIATSFEGFKKQFESIVTPTGIESPLAILCTQMLVIIGLHPTRFFDPVHADELPGTEAIKRALDPARKPKAEPNKPSLPSISEVVNKGAETVERVLSTE